MSWTDVMAKRFTDSDKWKDTWFQDLDPYMKLFWFYILDNCDCAGVWKINFRHFEFSTGYKTSKAEIEKFFHERIYFLNKEIAIVPKFIFFQYGKLNENNNAHKGVIKSLNYHSLQTSPLVAACLELNSSLEGSKDKEQDKDKDQDKEKDKAKEREKEKEKEAPADSFEIPLNILNQLKINLAYPDSTIEDIRKDAVLIFLSDQEKYTNWPRFVANYFKHEKPKIEECLRKKSKPELKSSQEMTNKLIEKIIQAGSHGLKEAISNFSKEESMAIEIFGRASEILNCDNFQLNEIKRRLKQAFDEVGKKI